MSTIVFVSQRIPERRLLTELVYRYYPDSELKDQIINDLKKHTGGSLDKYIIDLKIEVTLKEYDKYEAPDKNACYQEYLNTKTEE